MRLIDADALVIMLGLKPDEWALPINGDDPKASLDCGL